LLNYSSRIPLGGFVHDVTKLEMTLPDNELNLTRRSTEDVSARNAM
jgi:hypothetical protein